MPTATGPNGEKLVLQDGQWVPMQGAAAPRALPRMPTAAAAEEDRAIREGLRNAVGTVAANVLSSPHASGELLAAGAALPGTLAGAAGAAFRGEPLELLERFQANRSAQEQQFPANLLLALPDPDTLDVLAVPGALARALTSAGDTEVVRDPNAPIVAGGGIRKAFRESRAAEEARAAEYPIASTAGRIAGDVATMLLLRAGERMSKALRLGTREAIPADKGALDVAARTLGRGLGRTAEAGFEGAVMAALGDGDPVRTAAYAAGVQAGASVALSAKHSIMRNPIKSGVGIYAAHEIWKVIAPGPQDFFESKDAAFQEIVGAYAVGTLAGLAGGGRGGLGSGRVKEITSVLNDSARHSVQSVLTQLNEARSRGETHYEKVVNQLSADPDFFGQETRIRLERASRSEKPNALLNEIDALMKSTRFRQKFDAIQ